MIALKLKEYYPENCLYIGVQDQKTKLWSAAVAVNDRGIPGKILYSLDTYIYKTQEDAVNYLTQDIENALRVIKTMSN